MVNSKPSVVLPSQTHYH